MKAKFVAAIVLIVSVGFLGCQRVGSGPESKIPEVSLRQEWFPNANYAGALFASKDFAKEYKLKIRVEAGSDTVDPIKLVLSGTNTFGDAGADKVLAANAKGADLVVIGVLNLNSPACFIAKEEKNIRTPKDFEGQRVGVLSGTSTEYVYRTMVARLGLDKKKIEEIEAPFDLSSFIADAYDVRPAFIYDEPVSLDLQHVKYSIIEPRNYGITFMGTVYFTRRQTIVDQSEQVQRFVNAVADGWIASRKYPDKAIGYLKEYDRSIDQQRELLSLRRSLPYFAGKNGKILYAEIADWREMLKSLRNLNVVGDVNLETMIDNSFLERYYALQN